MINFIIKLRLKLASFIIGKHTFIKNVTFYGPTAIGVTQAGSMTDTCLNALNSDIGILINPTDTDEVFENIQSCKGIPNIILNPQITTEKM